MGAAPALKEMSQHPFCKNFGAMQKETVMKVTRFNESASTSVRTSMKLDLKCEAGPIRSGKINHTIFVIQHKLDVQVSHSSLLALK